MFREVGLPNNSTLQVLLTVRDTNSTGEHTNHRHFQERDPSFGKPVVDITAKGLGPHVKIYLKKSQQASQHLSICWAAPLPRPLGYSSHCSFSACHNRHHSYNNTFKHNEYSSEFKCTLDFQTLKTYWPPSWDLVLGLLFIYIYIYLTQSPVFDICCICRVVWHT